MSLRARVIAVVLLLTTLTAAVTGTAVVLVVRDWIYQDAQETALAEFRSEVERMPYGDEFVATTYAISPEYTVIWQGRVVQQGAVAVADVPPDMRRYLERTPSTYRFERRPNGNLLVGHSVGGGPGDDPMIVVGLKPLGDVSARLRSLTLLVIAAVVGSAVAAGVVGLFASRFLTSPLRRVQRVAASVADGDVDARLPETSVAELRDLTDSFNGMLDRQNESIDVLRRQDERSRRFVSDVSHELRSPLAALVPAAEVLREEADAMAAEANDDPDLARAARMVADEVDSLARLLDDLLEMTRLDAGAAEVRSERIDLPSTVRGALDARGWSSVRVDGPPELALVTDPRRVVAVVTNLVGNALRHGAPPVSVLVAPTAQGAIVEVRDHGQGVPPGHEQRIFERLHKVESARSRVATGGAGLGLAIARDNARLLGGDVDYRRDGAATVFRAWFRG